MILFDPQLPDRPGRDHSRLSPQLFPSEHFVTISSYLVCMFLYCLSFRFLREESLSDLMLHSSANTRPQAHSMQQIFTKRMKKRHRSPTYLFYRWGSLLVFNFSPLVFRAFMCSYWGSATQYHWFAGSRKAGLGLSSSPKAGSIFPVENPSTYHLTIWTSPCSLPNLPLHVLMFLQIWLPLGGAQQTHLTALLCQDFHDPHITILRLP